MKRFICLCSFLILLSNNTQAANSITQRCGVMAADGVTTLDDQDCDQVADISDNCTQVANGDCAQRIINCDSNFDGTLSDAELALGNQLDSDSDGIGDACETVSAPEDPVTVETPGDRDGDGFLDGNDNCITVANLSQQDSDQDGRGNACDNCPFAFNPDQADDNVNNIGDHCEIGTTAQSSPGSGSPGAGGNYFFAGHEFMSGSGSQTGCNNSLNPQTQDQPHVAIIFLATLIAFRSARKQLQL